MSTSAQLRTSSIGPKRRWPACNAQDLALLCACLLLAALGRAERLEDGALARALQRGGYVLVMRHASSPGKSPAPEATQADNLRDERELDETGRQSAQAMGQAMKRLGIRLGKVESSPSYRARETARLAGLVAAVEPELGDGGESMQTSGTARRSAWLSQHVNELPMRKTDTLLITHAPNILGAFGQEAAGIAEGETLIFRPDGHGSATLVARVKIEEWPQLVKRIP